MLLEIVKKKKKKPTHPISQGGDIDSPLDGGCISHIVRTCEVGDNVTAITGKYNLPQLVY